MTDPDGNEPETDREFRPIPDGGLASTLPAWLKEKPAWTRGSSPSRAIPPDTSPIDPRTLVHDDDLPSWLLAIARREQHLSGQDNEPPMAADPPAPRPIEDVAIPPAVPAWIANAQTDLPSPTPGDDVKVRRWIESGEAPGESRSRLRDPVIMGLVLVAILVVLVAMVLLIR